MKFSTLLTALLIPSIVLAELPQVEQQSSVNITVQGPTVYGSGNQDFGYGSYPGGNFGGIGLVSPGGYGDSLNGGIIPGGGQSPWGGAVPGMGIGMQPGINPGMSMQAQGCPFSNGDEKVQNLWNNTKQSLQDLARQTNDPKCMILRSNAATLQKALQQYSTEKNRALGGSSVSSSPYGSGYTGVVQPTCDNFKDVYRNEYHHMLQLVGRDYEMATMPQDYYSQCIDSYPLDVESEGYSDEFETCLGDTLARKIELATIECGGKEKYLDEIERDENSFKAKQDLLLQINGAMNELSTNIGQCSDKGMVQSALRSVINVGSMLAAPEIGGINGVWAAFGGNILDNVVRYIFSRDVQSSLADMESEDEYNRLACLFLNSQQMRCSTSPTLGMIGGMAGQLGCIDARRSNEEKAITDLMKELFYVSSGLSENKKLDNLSKLLERRNIQGKNVKQYLEGDVKRKLAQVGDFSTLSKLNGFLENLHQFETLMSQFQADPSSVNEASIQKLNDVKAGIDFREFTDILANYQMHLASENGTGFDATFHIEMAKKMSEQFQKASQTAMESWTNERKLGQITTLLVSNMKDKFKVKLKSHFNSDLKTAIKWEKGSRENPANRASAFNSLSGIINDCLLMEGMFAMGKSSIDGDALSTTLIEENDYYNKYCKAFHCKHGMPKADYDKMNPQKFEDHQCSKIYNYPGIIQNLKFEYEKTGKICGKSLKEIYKGK